MIRVVLAVLLTVGLLAVSLPAVDRAAAERTARVVETDVERMERATNDLLAAEDPTAPGVAGARRVVALRVPAAPLGRTGAVVVVEPGDPGRVFYRFDGNPPRNRSLGVPIRTPDGPIRLDAGGRYELALSPVSMPTATGPRVVVAVVVVGRS